MAIEFDILPKDGTQTSLNKKNKFFSVHQSIMR